MRKKKTGLLIIVFLLFTMMVPGCSKPTGTVSSQAASSVTASSEAASSESVSSETTSLSEPAATPTGSASQDGSSILTGTFQSIEWGDYLHLQMLGDDSIDYDFFILKNVGVDPESLTAGQKIKVTWQNVTKFLDPPGADYTFDEIILIELVDPS